MDTATRFKWLADQSSPTYYPTEIYTGYLANEQEFITPLPAIGSTNQGSWGESGASTSMGPELKAIPSMISVTWLAYAEKKIYHCEGKLDYQKILALFQKGYQVRYNDNIQSYVYVTVGLAPGGLVVVWLSGGGRIVEVGCFHGAETHVDINNYNRNPDNLNTKNFLQRQYNYEVDSTIKNNLAHGGKIPVGLWESYRDKYSWRPRVELPEGLRCTEIAFHNYNGEAEVLLKDGLAANPFMKRAVPEHFQPEWESADIKYFAEPLMDEAEIFQAFKSVYKDDHEKNVELVMSISADYKVMRFFLKSDNAEVELKKVKYRIFHNIKKKD